MLDHREAPLDLEHARLQLADAPLEQVLARGLFGAGVEQELGSPIAALPLLLLALLVALLLKLS